MYSLIEKLKKGGNYPQQKQFTQQKIQQQIPFEQKTQDTLIQDPNDDLLQFEQGQYQDEDLLSKPQVCGLLDRSKAIQKKQKLQSAEKKKKNKKLLGLREPWTEQYKLLSVQPPFLNDEKKSRKKYKIKLKFKDPSNKIRNYTIRFGDKNGGDYVDHHNAEKRTLFALRVRNCESVLNPNYWRVMLLNNEFQSIHEAWKDFVNNHDFLDIKI